MGGRLATIAVAMLTPLCCNAVELYDHFPAVVHADERYVIYSHGLIVEGNDPKPISPKYGQYNFPAIKQALFRAGDFNLIAYQRPKNSDFNGYVETLKSWVKALRKAGVPSSRITLVGFSRGGSNDRLCFERSGGRGDQYRTAGDLQRRRFRARTTFDPHR
jgi:hypothetical protein